MLTQIAYTPFLGSPLVMWFGIVNIVLLILTAISPKLFWRGKKLVSYKGHVRLAYITVAISVLHGLLGLAPHIGI